MIVHSIKAHAKIIALSLFLTCSFTLCCQSPGDSGKDIAKPAQPSIHFSVMSVRQNKSETEPPRVVAPRDGDFVEYKNYPLAYVLMFAFNFHRFDLAVGFPEWTKNDRYDIVAKVSPEDVAVYKTLKRPEREKMFQGVLAEKFALRVHFEPREASVYNLVVTKGGLKIKEANAGAVYSDSLKQKYGQNIMFVGQTELKGQSATMSGIALMLSNYKPLGRQVIDKTGLAGKYDFDLNWAEDQQTEPPNPVNQTSGASEADVSALFGAIQQQLGLKLEDGKANVDHLVIDNIARPSEN